jgi:adenosylhomocysteine nucleosidase
MTIGIIAAMDEEVHCIKDKLVIKQQVKISGFDFYFGTLSGKEVILSQSGIGKVNAAICTTLLIQTFKCRAIINTGAAAGLLPDMSVGDVVISEHVMHHDVDVTAFDYELGQVPGMPLAFDADKALVAALKKFSDDRFPHAIHTGYIISGDSFVDDARPIKEKFPVACALEMESGAVAQTCHRFDIPFVIVRSISDNGEKGADISFDKFVKIAGENSAILAEFLVGAL